MPINCTQPASMTWKPSEDVDREIRQWMKAKGWEVKEARLIGCLPSEVRLYPYLIDHALPPPEELRPTVLHIG